MLSIIQPDYASHEWENLPGEVRAEVREFLQLFSRAPKKGVVGWLEKTAKSTGTPFSTLKRKYYDLINNGGDWTVLVNKKKATDMRATVALTRQLVFTNELVRMAGSYQRKSEPAIRELKRLWHARKKPIPGYEDWPGWPELPAGWSNRNLARIIEEATNAARLRSIRIGTSSKTNPLLPTVLTTRVGLWPGAVIQLDDMWHRNGVTFGKKRELVNVLELGALDLFSGNRHHWGAKPRRKSDEGKYETLAKKDMRLFLAGMFHRTGYSPQGCMLMSENMTAKVEEDIARTLYDATGGLIFVDYQGIEGKQAALSGYWSGTEGGNFHAKACLESTHNLIHNDLGNLPMQWGHHSHGLKGPVTTARIAKYIERVLRDVHKKVPHREELLKLPTWDYHTQFIPWLVDYYQFGLNDRTDHDLEGWEALNHIVNEYTTIPGSGQYFDEETFLKLPMESQIAIGAAAKASPELWSRRRKLSPNEVWAKRGQFNPVPPVVLCDLLGQDLAREVTSRRGYLEFSDQEIAVDPLIYQARYCSGPNKGREIPHGEKVSMFALPFDDTTAMLVDAKGRFLGEVPLVKRVQPINTDAFGSSAPFEERPEIKSAALIKATAEKHSRTADILEPDRILNMEIVQEAKDLREHNRKVISGKPVTPEEIAEARTEAGHKGQKTAAANRLQSRGEAPDWDAATAPAPQSSAWDDLPDDEEIPEAL